MGCTLTKEPRETKDRHGVKSKGSTKGSQRASKSAPATNFTVSQTAIAVLNTSSRKSGVAEHTTLPKCGSFMVRPPRERDVRLGQFGGAPWPLPPAALQPPSAAADAFDTPVNTSARTTVPGSKETHHDHKALVFFPAASVNQKPQMLAFPPLEFSGRVATEQQQQQHLSAKPPAEQQQEAHAAQNPLDLQAM